MIDERLREWATAVEAEAIDAINETGSARAAARNLGIGESTIRDRITRLKTRAAAHGYSPDHDMTRTVPAPFIAKGVSTYYNRDGEAIGQWVKSTIDQQKWFVALKETVAEFSEEIQRLPPSPSTFVGDAWSSRLLNQYTFTDAHLGMLAWHEEGGANWDLKIAEQTILDCFELMLAMAPPAKKAVVAQLGDLLHSDGLLPVTPTSQHVLDQDGRYPKIVRAAIRVIRRLVERALERHETVHLLIAEGNHDLSGSVWMREMFSAFYELEPRVTVETAPLPYYAFKHGKTALFYHHGHKRKPAELPLRFAAQFPEIWGGDTRHRYGHTGHLHHIDEKDREGIVMMQHPTLAARDANASRGGWFGTRRATALTYHDDFGEVGRNHVTPEMVRGKR